MKNNKRHKLLPANPFRRIEGIDSLILGKQVFRLLRIEPSFPAYKEVHINAELVELVMEYEHHCSKVMLLNTQLRNEGGISWDTINGNSNTSFIIVTTAVSFLKEDYHNKPARLDEQLVAAIIEIVRALFYKLFLLEEISSSPFTAQQFHNRGHAHRLLGDPDKAVSDYTMAILLDPENPLYYFSRGSCFFKIKKDAITAIKDIDDALALVHNELQPHSIDILFLRSRLLKEIGLAKEAIESLRICVPIFSFLVYNVEWDENGEGQLNQRDRTNIVFIVDQLQACVQFCESFAQEYPSETDVVMPLQHIKSELQKITNIVL